VATLKLISDGKLDTEPLITHTYPISKIDEAYELFEKFLCDYCTAFFSEISFKIKKHGREQVPAV
jgi:threonine dehydrogenase-like Zn-dependent dehydrogenase